MAELNNMLSVLLWLLAICSSHYGFPLGSRTERGAEISFNCRMMSDNTWKCSCPERNRIYVLSDDTDYSVICNNYNEINIMQRAGPRTAVPVKHNDPKPGRLPEQLEQILKQQGYLPQQQFEPRVVMPKIIQIPQKPDPHLNLKLLPKIQKLVSTTLKPVTTTPKPVKTTPKPVSPNEDSKSEVITDSATADFDLKKIPAVWKKMLLKTFLTDKSLSKSRSNNIDQVKQSIKTKKTTSVTEHPTTKTPTKETPTKETSTTEAPTTEAPITTYTTETITTKPKPSGCTYSRGHLKVGETYKLYPWDLCKYLCKMDEVIVLSC